MSRTDVCNRGSILRSIEGVDGAFFVQFGTARQARDAWRSALSEGGFAVLDRSSRYNVSRDLEDPFLPNPLSSPSPSPVPGSSRKVRVKVEPETPSRPRPTNTNKRSSSPPLSHLGTPPPSSNFYVVTQGLHPGIYETWYVA